MSSLSLPGRRGRAALSRPCFEGLEDRMVPSTVTATNTLSGFVFADLNKNGLFDAGEPPIKSNTLQLYRGATATGTPIASAVTDGNGFYQFTTDQTISTAPTTKVATATFSTGKTNWTQTAQVAQFDPSLGTLLSIDFINTATLKTEFQVENLDNEGGNISSSVSGGVTVTVPGVGALAASTSLSDSFNAAADDGTIDFGGAGGHDSGLKSQSATKSVTNLTSAAILQAFQGTGTVTLSGRATATSSVNGPGNVLALLNTSAGAQVQVVYHYIPSNALRPGVYTILQTNTPTGYVSGLKSSAGVIIPNSTSVNAITVTLQPNTSSTNNNFAELLPPATPQVTQPQTPQSPLSKLLFLSSTLKKLFH
ncbi:MAG TPA: choice-of-anchor E domain-containing protein [Gemmataceae bacterium]|nr:choice-of-anchor E domain-containing protein [Gemmataceae bacterium]